MTTVRVLYDVQGWSFHHLATALLKHAPPDFEATAAAFNHREELDAALGTTAPDILVLQRPISTRQVRAELHRRGWRTRLVVIWNCGWPRRIEHLASVYDQADLVVFNNLEYWSNTGRLPKTRLIANGVDLDIFRVRTPLHERQPRVLWMGSEINRRLKGYDDFILPLADRLSRRGIACDFRLVDSFGSDKLDQQQMADWYNSGTVLVCASHTEGTPNTALEAAACGCTIVSTRVGNMPELIRDGENGYLVARNVPLLEEAVVAACANHVALATELQKDIQRWSWATLAAAFYEAFRELLAGEPTVPARPRAHGRVDLSDRVTVFVTSVGAASFDACLTHLANQDCAFRFELIDRVAPMNAAFQRMLDRCATPYYVQVDEDMLLYPHAVRTLHDRIEQEEADVALYVGWLHDVHLGEHIQGVKIFRHAIVRNYPFADSQGCEVDQIWRFQRDGYRYVLQPKGKSGDPFSETLGLHGTHWTPDLIYLRYATLEQRRRRRNGVSERVPGLPVILAEKLRQDPTELNFLALMGAIAGMVAPIDGRGREKDYTQYGSDPNVRLAARLFRDLTQKSGSPGGR